MFYVSANVDADTYLFQSILTQVALKLDNNKNKLIKPHGLKIHLKKYEKK